jgi:hypothetical protein
MTTFINLEARAAGSPKNAIVISAFTNQDNEHTVDTLYNVSPNRKPIVTILSGVQDQAPIILLKRETSTPKNAALLTTIGDGNTGLAVVQAGRQESGTQTFVHMKSDANGNYKSDQKHRGGIAG